MVRSEARLLERHRGPHANAAEQRDTQTELDGKNLAEIQGADQCGHNLKKQSSPVELHGAGRSTARHLDR